MLQGGGLGCAQHEVCWRHRIRPLAKWDHSKGYLGTEARPNSLLQVDGRQPMRLLHLVHHQVQLRTQLGRAGPRRSLVQEAAAPLGHHPQLRLQLLQILLRALPREGENVKGEPRTGREKAGLPLAKELLGNEAGSPPAEVFPAAFCAARFPQNPHPSPTHSLQRSHSYFWTCVHLGPPLPSSRQQA